MILKQLKCLTLLAALLPLGRAQAEPLRLSVDDALARAASSTTTNEVNESRRDLSLAKATLKRSQAWLPDDPMLSVGAYHSTQEEDIFNDEGELVGRRGYGPNYTFGLSQAFEVAGQRSLRIDAATGEVERARATLKFQKQAVAAAVRTAFVHALIENEKLAVAQSSHEATSRLASSRTQNNGDSPSARIDNNLLTIQQAHARHELTQARQSRNQAFAELLSLCRLPASQQLELVGTAETHVRPLADLPELLRRALENRPDLAAMQSGLHAANANLAAKHREKIPNVTISASVSQFAGDTLAGGEVSIPIPLFYGKAADVKEAVAERNHSARQLDLAKAEIEKELTQVYDACRAAGESLQEYQRDIVPLNEENLRIQRRLYEHDDSAVSSLIGTQSDYFTAQLQYLAAIEDYNVQLIELQRVVAGDIGPSAPVAQSTPAPVEPDN